MYWVIVFLMTIAAMGFLGWPLFFGTRRPRGHSAALWALAFTVPLLALGLTNFLRDNQNQSMTSSPEVNPIAWPGTSTLTRQVPDQTASSQAPVADLIDGLEERLAKNPADAKGWALLAQSYAFLADGSAAEAAIARAVALGFDEADLRNRVELAFQSSRTTHPGADQVVSPDPVGLVIGG